MQIPEHELKTGISLKEKPLSAHKIRVKAAVAGHICLDIIPRFLANRNKLSRDIREPGKLHQVGPAIISTGSAVANTGMALHRLGISTVLIARVGRDPFGEMILNRIRACGDRLDREMIVDRRSGTSYTVVISPPKTDRLFFHHPGANDSFGAGDVGRDQLKGVRLFHFGYPPLMKRMYQERGKALETLFAGIKKRGIITSLDTAMPDPASAAGRIDWSAILERVLPHVDIFSPSLGEILFMIDRGTFDSCSATRGKADLFDAIDTTILDDLAERLIEMGTPVVAIKLGSRGLYLRTGADVECLADADVDCTKWSNRQLLAPCFQTRVAGTTGAGDCTIAGLLAGVLRGLDPISAITGAVGAGAFSTESLDAATGIPAWDAVLHRIRSGWSRLDSTIQKPGWKWGGGEAVWRGPKDRTGS